MSARPPREPQWRILLAAAIPLAVMIAVVALLLA